MTEYPMPRRIISDDEAKATTELIDSIWKRLIPLMRKATGYKTAVEVSSNGNSAFRQEYEAILGHLELIDMLLRTMVVDKKGSDSND